MIKNAIAAIACVALVASVTPPVPPVEAAFGFKTPRIFKPRIRVPGRHLGHRYLVPRWKLRRALGVAAVAIIGVAILSELSDAQRREVGRRTTKVVETDPDKEVTDTYTTDKGKKTIKITASPSQPAASFRDDPALKVADTGEQTTSSGNTSVEGGPQGEGTGDQAITGDEPGAKNKTATTDSTDKTEQVADKGKGEEGKGEEADAKDDSLKLADLPESTLCRKVTTEYTAAGAKDKEGTATPETNTALMCQVGEGTWKPAVL